MTRIGKRLPQLLISRNAANVFRRCAAFTAHAAWINRSRVRRHFIFELQHVLSVVAKVMGILEVSAAREAERAQMNSLLVEHPVLLVQIGISVGPAANREFVQVIILPVHDGLNDPVEARQRGCGARLSVGLPSGQQALLDIPGGDLPHGIGVARETASCDDCARKSRPGMLSDNSLVVFACQTSTRFRLVST